MFLLTRRQAHAALAGVAAAATYLAAAEISSKKPVRFSGLFLLSSMAMAGMATKALGSHASAKAYHVEARLNNFLGNGGSLGGPLYVNGDHHVTGSSFTGNHTISGQLFGSGGTVDFADHANMQGNNVTAVNDLSGNGGNVQVTGFGLGMLDSIINMNSHDITNISHIAPTEIGPGGTRADLSGTQTLATLTARSNFHNELLNAANIGW